MQHEKQPQNVLHSTKRRLHIIIKVDNQLI